VTLGAEGRSVGRDQGGSRLFVIGLADDARLEVGLGPREVILALALFRFGHLQIVGRGLQGGFQALGLGPGADGIDLQQEVAGLDRIAFLHRKARDLAHDVG